MDLKAFDFYNDLTSDDIILLEKHLKPIHIETGTTLFYQGDTTEDILLLVDGNVRVYIQGEGIEEITLYTLNPTEQCIVNTSSTITKTPAIGTAITTSAISGYLMNRDIVHQLMAQNSSYQSYIFSLFTIRLDSVTRVLESVKFKQMDERIYEWLQAQGDKEISITHEEIANHIGSTRVVVSRTLKKMEQEGLIILSRGKITLL